MSAPSPTDPERSPWWDRPDPAGWRVIVPALIALVVQVGMVLGVGPRGGLRNPFRGLVLGPDAELGFSLVVAIVGALLLLAARLAPGPTVAAIAALTVLDVTIADDDHRFPLVALSFAIVSAVARGARAWAWASVAVAIVALLVLSPFFEDEPQAGQVGVAAVVTIVSFGVGEAIRAARSNRADARRAAEVRRDTAARAERERIARELHDVLAHSLSQISVQAGVGLHLSGPGRPEALARARDALTNIRSASGTALDDVRMVIGALRAPGEAPLAPEAGLDRLEQLITTARDAGLTATLTSDIRVPVPRGVQTAAFRIAQESVTNALRHARADALRITVTTQGQELRLDVVDDGVGAPADAVRRAGGLGLAGMSERAELLGGTLTAGPVAAPGRGWQVSARLPLSGAVA